MEGNLHFKIHWAGLIAGRKFTVFALFDFVFEGNFQVQAFFEGFLHYKFRGLIFGGADTWTSLFYRILRYVFCNLSKETTSDYISQLLRVILF